MKKAIKNTFIKVLRFIYKVLDFVFNYKDGSLND